jgi:hypothetical protein
MKYRALASLLIGIAVAPFLPALDIEPFTVPVARFAAMGGPHVALADDYSLLFANPAGLSSAHSQFFVAQVGAQAAGPLFDIGQALLGGGDYIQSVIKVLTANNYKLYSAADMAGPLSFGYVGKGIGFGLFNRTHAIVDAAGISSVRIFADEDILLVGGYSFGIDIGAHNRVEAGILAKGFARGGIAKSADALALMNTISNPLGQPFSLATGIGIDLGLRWAWTGGLSAGLACRDLYSPILVSRYSSVQGFLDNPQTALTTSETDSITRNLAFGIAYTMPAGGLFGLVDSLVLALDYSHILDLLEPFYRNPILNVGIGLETRILDIVALRAGISEGYPAAGATLDLSVMKLNLAVWGRELGQEPGSRPAFNLMTSLEFSY